MTTTPDAPQRWPHLAEEATPEQLDAIRDFLSSALAPLQAIHDAIGDFARALDRAEAAARAFPATDDAEADGD